MEKVIHYKGFDELTANVSKCFVLNPIIKDKNMYCYWDDRVMNSDYPHIEKEYRVLHEYKHTKNRNVFVPVDVWATAIVVDNVPTEYIDDAKYVIHGNYAGANWEKIKGNLEVIDRVLSKYDGDISEYVLIIPYRFIKNHVSKVLEAQPNFDFNYDLINNVFKNGKSKIRVVAWDNK